MDDNFDIDNIDLDYLFLESYSILNQEENNINQSISTVSNNVLTFKYDIQLDSISSSVNYLFLFVPQILIQNEEDKIKKSKKPYKDVCNHMTSFFEPQNYTNVRGVVVFGY